MKIYAYLRVSTDQQAESGAGLAAQRESCLRWAEAQGLVIEQLYTDEGVSGSTGLDRRPALLDATSSLKKGDVLLVAKRDRLGRDVDLVRAIQKTIERRGARVVSIAEQGTDGHTSSSILTRQMFDVFAEFERNIIRDRTRDAMQEKKKRNERVGHIPFGFRLAHDEIHLEEDEAEQSILGQIQGLINNGLSTREIAAEMNRRQAFNRGGARWNHGSIHRIITRMAA